MTVDDFPWVSEIFFPCAFLMAGSVFCDGHIFVSNQDIDLVSFYRSAFGYFSPCEGFYRVSLTPLFFIRPGKVEHSIHGARRWVTTKLCLGWKERGSFIAIWAALLFIQDKGNSAPLVGKNHPLEDWVSFPSTCLQWIFHSVAFHPF